MDRRRAGRFAVRVATLREVLEDLGRSGKSPMVAAQARFTAAQWLLHEANDQPNQEQSRQFVAAVTVLRARALEDIQAAVSTEVDVYVGYGTRDLRITDAAAERIRTERAQDEQDRVRRLRKGAGEDAANVPGHNAESLLEWAENRNIAMLDRPLAVNPNTRGAVEHVADLRFTRHAGSAAGFARGELDAIKKAEDKVAFHLLGQADSAVRGYLTLESLRYLDGARAAARGLAGKAPGIPGGRGAGQAGPPSAEGRTAKEPRGAAHEADKSPKL